MQLNLKPTSTRVRDYYNALNQYGQLNISHETAVRQAFASLLDNCARQFQWKLVHEFPISLPKNKRIIVDGAVLDTFTLKHGYWEAKDLKDDLEKEIKKKLELGYPRNNTIFQSPQRAILYQKGIRQGLNEDITNADNLVELLKVFFDYREPQHQEWEAAVAEFSERIPEIAAAVKELIDKEKRKNQKFVAAFAGFVLLCRQAINPNLSDEAVEKMLIQHLLTERIFRKVFNNPEFTRRNIIAAEIEKVIDSLTSKHFSRDAFLEDLNRFYHAIEVNAENATDFSEKQTFLKADCKNRSLCASTQRSVSCFLPFPITRSPDLVFLHPACFLSLCSPFRSPASRAASGGFFSSVERSTSTWFFPRYVRAPENSSLSWISFSRTHSIRWTASRTDCCWAALGGMKLE